MAKIAAIVYLQSSWILKECIKYIVRVESVCYDTVKQATAMLSWLYFIAVICHDVVFCTNDVGNMA